MSRIALSSRLERCGSASTIGSPDPPPGANVQRRTLRLHLAGLAALALSAAGLTLAPGLASASTQAAAGHTLAPNTRFYVPPPAQGSVKQIVQLIKSGQL